MRWVSLLVLASLLSLGCGSGKEGEPVPPEPKLYLTNGRVGHTATLLQDGRVLVAGGFVGQDPQEPTTYTSELVDPARHQVLRGLPMALPRALHTATRLPDGRVLITGGQKSGAPGDIALDSAELFDPATGRFTPTGSMACARHSHTATLLNSGLVFIAGGDGPSPDLVWRAGELYDPATGAFQLLEQHMVYSRTGHSATLLDSGLVLIAGGMDWVYGPRNTAEIFDPATNGFRFLSSTLSVPFPAPGAIKLASGKVLFVLGIHGAQLFEPTTEQFSAAIASVVAKDATTPTPTLGGGVLLIGGMGTGTPPPVYASIEKYNENANRFEQAGYLLRPRVGHAATLLADGRVAVIGGTGPDFQRLLECELITPH